MRAAVELPEGSVFIDYCEELGDLVYLRLFVKIGSYDDQYKFGIFGCLLCCRHAVETNRTQELCHDEIELVLSCVKACGTQLGTIQDIQFEIINRLCVAGISTDDVLIV